MAGVKKHIMVLAGIYCSEKYSRNEVAKNTISRNFDKVSLSYDEITGCYIYLTSTQVNYLSAVWSQLNLLPSAFLSDLSCIYLVNDVIDFHDGTHCGYCATISEIYKNRILLTNLDYSMRSWIRDRITYSTATAAYPYRHGWSDCETYDSSDYSISVQDKYSSGVIQVSENKTYVFGNSNIAVGKYVYILGGDNKSCGDYSAVIGYDNVNRNYGGLIFGISNNVQHMYGIAIGSKNSSYASYGIALRLI